MKPSPFLCAVEEHMLVRRYSRRTVGSYLYWIKYFILHHGKGHPATFGPAEVEAFLTHLAVERHVSAATQAIALNALAYLYNKYLQQPLGDVSQFRRSNRQRSLPVVLTRQEVASARNPVRPACVVIIWMNLISRKVQEQLGQADVKTTAIYTHVLNRGAHGVRSPLSDL